MGDTAAVGWVRGLGLIACLCVTCGSACSSGDDTPTTAATAAVASSSTSGNATLPAGFDANSPDCLAGKPACVDATIAEMTKRLAPLLATCDHNAVFALTYLRTTQQLRKTIDDPTSFSDVGYMSREDAVFASFYFAAYDAWTGGRDADVPAAWKIAFDAARSEQVTGIGNALLGISAHINRDLPFVLASLGLVTSDGASREADHDKINAVLGRVIGPMTAEAAARLDPTMTENRVGDQVVSDDAALKFIIGWRDNAWANAEKLVAAPTAEAKAEVARQIDAEAAATSHGLLAATTYQESDGASARDTYCATHHG